MPTTYAHNVFGKAVMEKLPLELQNIVQENQMAYQIGLHGPDVLFYYKPFSKNPVSEQGTRMHQEPATGIFLRFKGLLMGDADPELLAYAMGFICHFMLDSTCHPFIGQYGKETGARHDELETDFDRVLMELTGKNPLTYRPGKFIHVEKHTLKVMEKVLSPVTEKELSHALKAMRFYTNVVVRPTRVGRRILLRGMKLFRVYDSMQGRVMRKKRSKRCIEGSRRLLELFHLAVPETVTVIEDFCRTLGDSDYISGRFGRNFE